MWFDVKSALAAIERGEGSLARSAHPATSATPATNPASVAGVATVAGGWAQETDFEERAAISEFDGGLSRPHAEALAALQVIPLPIGVSQGQMAEIIDLAARRLDRLRLAAKLTP